MEARGTRRRLTRTQLAIAFAALLAAPAFAGGQLEMRVRPSISTEPATLALDVMVEKHAANRAVQIVIDSEEYYRSSLVQLDGDYAPRVISTQYPALPAGSYEVQAVLFGTGEKPRATARRHIEVLPRAGR